MLSIENIDTIEREVELSGISFSHLSDDLVDHICCDVESQIQNGILFEEAFKSVKEKIGVEGLKRIEDQTILIINQNYIIMKKALNVLSIFSASLVIISGLFKILHFPGASILLNLAFMGLLFGFIPLLFLTRNKEDKERKQVWVNISGYLTATVFLLSLLWAMMHWPGRSWLVLLSWILIIAFFLPAYISTVLKEKNNEKRFTHIGVILLIVFLVVIQIVLTVNSTRSPYIQYDTVINNSAEMTSYLEHENNYLYAVTEKDSLLSENQLSLIENLSEQSANLKTELMSLAMEIDKLNDFQRIRMKDNKPVNYKERIDNLLVHTLSFDVEITEKFNLSPEMKSLILKTFESQSDGLISMYDLYFSRKLIVVRNNLLRLHNNILFIENEILTDILHE